MKIEVAKNFAINYCQFYVMHFFLKYQNDFTTARIDNFTYLVKIAPQVRSFYDLINVAFSISDRAKMKAAREMGGQPYAQFLRRTEETGSLIRGREFSRVFI